MCFRRWVRFNYARLNDERPAILQEPLRCFLVPELAQQLAILVDDEIPHMRSIKPKNFDRND